MFDANMALRCSRKVRDVACMPRLSRIAVNPVMAPPVLTIVSAVWSISCKTDANCIEDRIQKMTKTRSRRALPPALRRIYTTLSRQALPEALDAIAEVRDTLDTRSARRQAMLLRLRLLRAALDEAAQPPVPAPAPDPEPVAPPPPPEPEPLPEPEPEPLPEPEPEIIPPPRKKSGPQMMKLEDSAMAALLSQLSSDDDEDTPTQAKTPPEQGGA